MDNNSSLAKVENNTPAELIKAAVVGKADLDKLEKLLTLQERWEINEARKAYHKAMAEFKANPPRIDKDKTVSFNTTAGKTSYNHASLANVTGKINSELSKYGLSASWSTKQDGSISVTCRITHELGHSEETTLSAGADTSGSKNSIQAIGSTITYLERYTLLALTGLATCDMDSDAQAAGVPVEYISIADGNIILDMVAETGAKLDKLLAYLKVDKLENMLKSDYPKAVAALKAFKKQKAAKAVKK